MDLLNYLASPQVLYGLIFIGALVILYARMTETSLKEKAVDTGINLLIKRLEKDKETTRKNEQLERIGEGSKGSKKQYRELVRSILISLKIEKAITVENFTTFLILSGILFFMAFTTAFNSILIGILVAVPSVFAILAALLSFTKLSIRANDNRVMDSLDLICPAIETSIVAAIKNNVGTFDIKIQKHYQNFLLDISARDMSMREAMAELNKSLGPRFDEFARKAILFDDAGEEGMSEIFRDIVEMNNFTRSINSRADRVYQEINFNTLSSSAIVLGFLGYAYTNELTGEIMRNNFFGKLGVGISIAIIILMYAVSQITQMSIDYNKVTKD